MKWDANLLCVKKIHQKLDMTDENYKFSVRV